MNVMYITVKIQLKRYDLIVASKHINLQTRRYYQCFVINAKRPLGEKDAP